MMETSRSPVNLTAKLLGKFAEAPATAGRWHSSAKRGLSPNTRRLHLSCSDASPNPKPKAPHPEHEVPLHCSWSCPAECI